MKIPPVMLKWARQLFGKNTPCAICGKKLKILTVADWAKYFHQDTLGGAFSMEACETCRQHRVTGKQRVARVCLMYCSDLSVLPDENAQRATLESIDHIFAVDGRPHGMAVHVFHEGGYVRVLDWIKTEEHQKNIESLYNDGFTVEAIIKRKEEIASLLTS